MTSSSRRSRAMRITSTLDGFPPTRVRTLLRGLPAAGYRLEVKPLRYLHEVLGRKGSAETACDRYALQHFAAEPDETAGGARRGRRPRRRGPRAGAGIGCVGRRIDRGGRRVADLRAARAAHP